jgi:hypothetical protein
VVATVLSKVVHYTVAFPQGCYVLLLWHLRIHSGLACRSSTRCSRGLHTHCRNASRSESRSSHARSRSPRLISSISRAVIPAGVDAKRNGPNGKFSPSACARASGKVSGPSGRNRGLARSDHRQVRIESREWAIKQIQSRHSAQPHQLDRLTHPSSSTADTRWPRLLCLVRLECGN